MRKELIEAINIQAKREGYYLPIVKALVFEELSKKYNTKPLNKILSSSRGGSWGEDNLTNGLEAISLRSPDIRHGFIDFENGKKRFYELDSFEKLRLEDGDIVVIKSNGSLDLVGKSQVFYSNSKYPNITASNFLMILKPNLKLVNPKYLDAFLKSPQSLIWRVEKQRTTTGLRNLDSKGYLSVQVPIPEDLETQGKISELIDNLSKHVFPKTNLLDIVAVELASKISERFIELLEEFESNKQLLSKLKQAILQEAIQGKLTEDWRTLHPELVKGQHSATELLKHIKEEKAQLIADKKIKKEKPLPPITKEEIPFKIPKGWVWCKFGDYTIFERGRFSARPRNDQSFFGGNIPFIQIGSLTLNGDKINSYKQTLNERGLKVSKLFPKDTITIAIVGGTIGYLGILEQPMCFPDSIVGIKPNKFSFQDFVFLLLKINQNHIRKLSYQMSGQPNIKLPNLNNLIIPLPPLEEQKEIVEKVEMLMQKCQALEEEIKQSETNAQMLMQAVLKEAFVS